MEVKKLDFGETLKDSVAIGVKNAPSVIAAVALWLITIWIPYLNVGTTIAITLLPTQLAKGEIVNRGKWLGRSHHIIHKRIIMFFY